MATIQKILNTNNPSYRVFIRRQGCKTLSKTFPTKKLAKEFALRMESDVSAMHSMQGKSSTTLFKDLVAEYLYKEYRGVRLKEQGRKLGYCHYVKWAIILICTSTATNSKAASLPNGIINHPIVTSKNFTVNVYNVTCINCPRP